MENNDGRGALVVLEGLSSSGKSVGIEKILQQLDGRKQVVLVRWNSNRKVRWVLRILIRRGWITPLLYCLLQWKSFLVDYFFIIRPNLKRGKLVIADRYIYTAFTRDTLNGIDKKLVYLLYAFARQPDLILYFKTPPEVCLNRARRAGKKIFYLCRHIRNSKLIGDKELHYLRELYCHYTEIFDDFNVYSRTEVIDVGKEIRHRVPLTRTQVIPADTIQALNNSLVTNINEERGLHEHA